MNTTQQTIEAFFATYPTRHLERGEQLLLPDPDVIPPITFLQQGRVAQYDITDAGIKVTLNVFKPQTFFPTPSAINHQPNRYFFEVTSASATIRQAPAEAVEAFLKTHPDVTYNLLSRVFRGTEGLLGRLSLLLNGTASARLSYEVTIQADRFGERDTDGVVTLHITEEELAAHTGLSRETISRELKKLQESGFLTHSRGIIRLL
jgi:CRP/FNR family transcriptional regulator